MSKYTLEDAIKEIEGKISSAKYAAKSRAGVISRVGADVHLLKDMVEFSYEIKYWEKALTILKKVGEDK